MTHPRYLLERRIADLVCWATAWDDGPRVYLGDEVSHADDGLGLPIGTVTDIHGESFGDGPGDTITVIPAAVTLSTGDRYPVADLVLLRRAEA